MGFDFSELKVDAPIAQWTRSKQFAGYIHQGLKEESEGLSRTLLEDLWSKLREHLENGNEDLRVDLGVTLDLLGQPKEAIAELRIAESRQDKDAHYPLGRILLEQKLANPAAPDTAKSAPEKPGKADKTINTPASQPSWTAVANQLRKAIDYDPGNKPALYYLGKAILGLVEDESLKTAAEIYNQYLSAGTPIGHRAEVQEFLNSQDKELQKKAAVQRGKEALAADKAPESITAFEEAIRLGDQTSYYYQGEAFEKSGNVLRAIDAYQRLSGFKEVRKKLSMAVSELYCNPALLIITLKTLINTELITEAEAKTKSQLFGIAKWLNEYSPNFQLSLFLMLELGEPEYIHLSGNPIALDALTDALTEKWDDPKNIHLETLTLSVEATDEKSFIIRNAYSGNQAIEIGGGNRDLDTNIKLVKHNLDKIVRWKRMIDLDKSDNKIRDWFDFEMVVSDKNQRKTTDQDSEVKIYGTKESPFTKSNENGIIEINFQARLKMKFEDLYLYVFDLSSGCAIKFRSDEEKVLQIKNMNVGDTMLLRSKPYCWGLEPNEQEMTRWFKLLATTKELDPLLLEQKGLIGDREEEESVFRYPKLSSFLYVDREAEEDESGPKKILGDWCTETIKFTLVRQKNTIPKDGEELSSFKE